ncbi:hypothetical protein XENORESO_008378 [Xenotaenia resolanae]|uniref:Uncharacterized protein n=1 Tax=Xenotaenia resolanae TaxID=208358 RepID=A0ABV0W7S3_9TELE
MVPGPHSSTPLDMKPVVSMDAASCAVKSQTLTVTHHVVSELVQSRPPPPPFIEWFLLPAAEYSSQTHSADLADGQSVNSSLCYILALLSPNGTFCWADTKKTSNVIGCKTG